MSYETSTLGVNALRTYYSVLRTYLPHIIFHIYVNNMYMCTGNTLIVALRMMLMISMKTMFMGQKKKMNQVLCKLAFSEFWVTGFNIL